MTPFRFDKTFRGTPALYWQVLLDEGCMRAQYLAIGVRAFEVRELRDDGDTVTRTVHVVPRRELPGFIRALTGASLAYDETTVWHRAAQRAETTVVPSVLAGRVSIGGTVTLDVPAPDRVRRVFEGAIDVRVPLVGGRIERSIFEDMTASYELGAEITQRWLDAAAEAAIVRT